MSTVLQNENPATKQTVKQERAFVAPNVNIVETAVDFVLEAEMPGVAKDGLDISVEENVLTIAGRRQAEPQGNLLHRESRAVDYRRIFQLDPSIERDKISAQIEQGLLTVRLPKAEKAKPRKIEVN
jgi:HSP20 family protein